LRLVPVFDLEELRSGKQSNHSIGDTIEQGNNQAKVVGGLVPRDGDVSRILPEEA